MAVIGVADIQQWLESTKVDVSTLDNTLEKSVRDEVYAQLAGVYTTTSWVDENTTPGLVKTIVSLYYAGSLWNRTYQATSSKPGGYGDKLIQRAQLLIMGLQDGTVDLIGLSGSLLEPTSEGDPIFYPTDESTELSKTDPYNEDASGRYFTMAQMF